MRPIIVWIFLLFSVLILYMNCGDVGLTTPAVMPSSASAHIEICSDEKILTVVVLNMNSLLSVGSDGSIRLLSDSDADGIADTDESPEDLKTERREVSCSITGAPAERRFGLHACENIRLGGAAWEQHRGWDRNQNLVPDFLEGRWNLTLNRSHFLDEDQDNVSSIEEVLFGRDPRRKEQGSLAALLPDYSWKSDFDVPCGGKASAVKTRVDIWNLPVVPTTSFQDQKFGDSHLDFSHQADENIILAYYLVESEGLIELRASTQRIRSEDVLTWTSEFSSWGSP